ncbi:hypothetical protein RND81_14G030400 [Saponaria officinalis]
MQNKDFVGARKFILKAQQLFPELENISQLLSVCDVHCSAEKMFGNDKDWYGILQVEQTADDTLIKKQYRKFALLLHPDKNQFAGAEAAFKLIGEAQRILLDKDKRASHDLKRRTPYKPVIPHQQSQPAGRNAGGVRQSRPQNNYASNPNSHYRASNFANLGQTHQAQPGNAKETFWTSCLHCSGRYQYYKEVLGRAIFCTSCKKPFVAFDVNATKSGTTQPVFPQQAVPTPTFNAGFQAGQKAGVSRSQTGSIKVERNRNSRSKSRKSKGRRRKHQVDTSDSSESDTSLDSEEVEIHEAAEHQKSQHHSSDGDRQTRRSNRNRRHVSYHENESDDEQVVTSSKKAKLDDLTEGTEDASTTFGSDFGEEDTKKECYMDERNDVSDMSTKNSSEAHDGLNSSREQKQEPTLYVYPDPEFSDFGKTREMDCFKVGQLWAAYDVVDAMPRYYAKINRVYNPGFKLKITWLEADPDDKVGKQWTKLELPFACGKFKKGDTLDTEDHGMFSHEVRGYKSIGRNSFRIYPNVGETWAIFKNWDVKWCSVPESARKFEYEFVEILSDFDETGGIRVAPLGKLKGFASLFCRKSVNEIQIRPSEVLRFSHMVPSFRMNGDERIDVPKGSFELDPACITENHEEISLP